MVKLKTTTVSLQRQPKPSALSWARPARSRRIAPAASAWPCTCGRKTSEEIGQGGRTSLPLPMLLLLLPVVVAAAVVKGGLAAAVHQFLILISPTPSAWGKTRSRTEAPLDQEPPGEHEVEEPCSSEKIPLLLSEEGAVQGVPTEVDGDRAANGEDETGAIVHHFI